MAKPKAFVIGTSAGGVEALTRLVSGLPADFSIPVFIVLHVSPEGSVLPAILNRNSALPATHPKDGERIEAGRIYVAPPDLHMTVHTDRVRIVRGPKENRHRPAIDPLFKSAAAAYGAATVGIILTGLLDDGTAGLKTIKRRGGTAIVQDPKDAVYSAMPTSAIEAVAVDHILPLADIAPLLVRLAREPGEEGSVQKEGGSMDKSEFAEFDISTIRKEPQGTPSSFSCPDCHGTLWETHDDKLVSFRCRTGHSFTPSYLMEGQAEAADAGLWETLRALEEQAALFRRLAERAEGGSSMSFTQRAEEKDRDAALIRALLLGNKKA